MMFQGRGTMVVTLRMLRVWRMVVARYSRAAWTAMARRVLKVATLTILTSFCRPRRCGRCASPRALMPELRLGMAQSKARKNSAGSRKHNARTSRVP